MIKVERAQCGRVLSIPAFKTYLFHNCQIDFVEIDLVKSFNLGLLLMHNDLNLQHLKPTDFNDLHQIAGLEIVKNQIHNSTQMIVKHHEFGID